MGRRGGWKINDQKWACARTIARHEIFMPFPYGAGCGFRYGGMTDCVAQRRAQYSRTVSRTTLIINADDFGFSTGITDGILESHRAGILTSTTLMATMPDALRAAALARECPDLGVGIHLCLTQGTACAGGLRALTDAHGQFPPTVSKLFITLARRRHALADCEMEWSAQVEKAMAAGIVPTHLDSHKHVHHWPPLANIALRVAGRFNIPAIRAAREIEIPEVSRPWPYRGVAALAQRLARRAAEANIRVTDWFFGLSTTGATDWAVWQRLIENCPPGIGEIMVHPGYISGLTTRDTRLLAQRTVEQQALCNPSVKAALDAHGIAGATYRALSMKA